VKERIGHTRRGFHGGKKRLGGTVGGEGGGEWQGKGHMIGKGERRDTKKSRGCVYKKGGHSKAKPQKEGKKKREIRNKSGWKKKIWGQ